MASSGGKSREQFLKEMGLTKEDLVYVPPKDELGSEADQNANGARQLSPAKKQSNGDDSTSSTGNHPDGLNIDDGYIRSAQLADTEALKASPHNVTATVAYRDEQLKKFRETRSATISRELGLEDGVAQRDDLVSEGTARHSAAQSYKAQLLAEYRKKRQNRANPDVDEM